MFVQDRFLADLAYYSDYVDLLFSLLPFSRTFYLLDSLVHVTVLFVSKAATTVLDICVVTVSFHLQGYK